MQNEPDAGPEKISPAGNDALFDQLYAELKLIARRERRRTGSFEAMQTTALIGEAYIRLRAHTAWADRSHFLACASKAMRHILIDGARSRMAKRNGGGFRQTDDDIDLMPAEPIEDEVMIRLGNALDALSVQDANLAKVIDFRFFAGFSEMETAAAMGVSDRTVRRWWTQARAWVHAEMTKS
jgi:RNA polymerase sigma factor (TIGR02999 family)